MSPEELEALKKIAAERDVNDISQYAPAQAPTEPISQLDAAIKGGRQGLTLGFGDELRSGAGALGDVAFGDTKLADLSNAYRSRLAEERAGNEAASEQHPMTYGAGELAGGLVIPGAATAKGAAGLAALSGLGRSTAGTVGGMAEDAALAAGPGMLLRSASPQISKVVAGQRMPDTAEQIASRALMAKIGQASGERSKEMGIKGVNAANRAMDRANAQNAAKFAKLRHLMKR